MKIRCLIVDDEPLALSVIEKYINKVKDMVIIAKCENALMAFEILKKNEVDLIFLDIQMPELTGIQFIKTLEKAPQVIITSAYREYAIDGFDLNVLDYLLKPISFERFLKAVRKYYKYVTPESALKNRIINVADSSTNQFLLVKEKKNTVKVPFDEILFIESLKDYIKIIMKKRTVVTKMYISDIEKLLPSDNFIRIHRSFVIPVGKIDLFSPNHVEIGEYEIPIGRSYKNLVLKRLGSED